MVVSRGGVLIILIVVLVLAALPVFGSRYALDLTTQVLIYALFALSLNVVVGQVGDLSFGHAAFLTIGGYGSAIFVTSYGIPFPLGVVAAVAMTSIAALFIGYVCVHLTKMHFAMLTLAFSMLIWSVAVKWRGVTGGDDGFVGVAVPEYLASPEHIFYFTLCMTSLSAFVLWNIANSTFGQAMMAIRENEKRAKLLGINVKWVRIWAFVVSGTFAGLAGVLLASYNRSMFPESAFWTESGKVLIMALLGGIHYFIGPIVGAATLHVLETWISQLTEYWQFVLGSILIAIVLLAPEGIVGVFTAMWRQMKARDHA